MDASPAGVSPVPSTTPRTGRRQELLGPGAAAVASRRGSKLRFPLELERQSDNSDGVLVDEHAEKAGEGEGEGEGDQDKADDFKMSRQASRESIMSSSAAFFPSDTENEHENEDEGGQRKGEEGHAKEEEKKKQQRPRPLAADKDTAAGPSKLNSGHGEQPQQGEDEGVEKEVPLREQEEEEIVALSSYLASARRGWPWVDQNVLWAEYVTLNGHHRCVLISCVDFVLILTLPPPIRC